MFGEFIHSLSNGKLNVVYEKGQSADSFEDSLGMIEGIISTTDETLTEKLISELKASLKACELVAENDQLVLSTVDDPSYFEGTVIALGEKSAHFALQHTLLKEILSNLSEDVLSGSTLKVTAAWPLLDLQLFKNVMLTNQEVIKEFLFLHFCKRVRRRGGGRNNEAVVVWHDISYDAIHQSLLGVPINSLVKRAYNHLSNSAVEYRNVIETTYSTQMKKMIDEGMMIEELSSDNHKTYRPILIEELKELPIATQKSLANKYNVRELG
ncbi:hypothetical protein VCHA53O466_40078 [Vibrio chagasii]|nr:hypothetical protein VCHA53O466_40078 [Vibrio chagasii]